MTNSSNKILVVDDIVDWQKTVSGVLKDKGFDVSTAGSIKDALSLLEKEKYALALLDLRLDETDEGNTDGLKLAEIIKQRWNKIKIIIVTGYGSSEILTKAMAPTADGVRLVNDYLPKGDTDKLIETVQRVLAKK